MHIFQIISLQHSLNLHQEFDILSYLLKLLNVLLNHDIIINKLIEHLQVTNK